MFDLSAAADVAGGKFAILRNDAVLLELGLVQWAVNKAVAAGFTPVMAPDVAHAHIVAGCGFRPRDGGGESSQVSTHTLRVGGHSCTCVLMQLRGGGCMCASDLRPSRYRPVPGWHRRNLRCWHACQPNSATRCA